jgi:hypothetical protein
MARRSRGAAGGNESAVVDEAACHMERLKPLWHTDPVSAGRFTGVVTLGVLFMAKVLASLGR